MRVTSSVVIVSSVLFAAAAIAQPKGGGRQKKGGAKTGRGSAAAPASGSAAGSGAATGSGSAAAPTPTPTPTGSAGDASTTGSAGAPTDPSAENVPTQVRIRKLEQQTTVLKERAWQLKARVQMLKEQMLGGGVGAQAVIAHGNEMGTSFRLIRIVYTLDGTQVLVRNDDAGESLYKTRSFDVFSGPISPGNHTVTAVATYRGHGYGVFDYLTKYTFTARGNTSFTAGEGKVTRIDCRGYEKGGPNTALEKRPALDCKVTQMSPDRAPTTPVAAPPPAASTEPGK